MTPGEMVATESICLAFMSVVLVAYIVLPRGKSLRRDGFFWCLVLTMAAVVADMTAWICELSPSSYTVQYVSNFLSLVMSCFIVPAFGYYIVELINEKQSVSYRLAHAITAVNGIAVVVTAVAGATGNLFDIHPADWDPAITAIDDGGFFYEFPMIVSTITLMLMFALVIKYGEAIGKEKLVVFAIYFLLPVVTCVIEIVTSDYLLSYVASGVSVSIVYVLMQSGHMEEMQIREQLLKVFSYEDQLTGLPNRRACDRDVEALPKDETVRVVFCDMNGLKQVNDSKGHHAGDQLIKDFANLLSNVFTRESVYRISGDEFVVLEHGISEDDFAEKVARMKRDIASAGGIASFGAASGRAEEAFSVAHAAEKNMYIDKKDFYSLHPECRR